jgi:hypothetical protein
MNSEMADSVTKFFTSENHDGMRSPGGSKSRRGPFFGLQPHFNIAEAVAQGAFRALDRPLIDGRKAEKETQKHRSGELDTHFRRTNVVGSGFQTPHYGPRQVLQYPSLRGLPSSTVDSLPRPKEYPEEFIRHLFILRRTSAHLPSFADSSALIRRRPRHTDQTTPIGAVVFSWCGCV